MKYNGVVRLLDLSEKDTWREGRSGIRSSFGLNAGVRHNDEAMKVGSYESSQRHAGK